MSGAWNFEGKTVLVTGASRGIGEAVARELARSGARVIISSRKIDTLRELADSMRAEGGEVFPMACHVGHPEEISKLFEKIAADFGGLDILINNGAANPWFGPAVEAPGWAFDKTFEVNVSGWFKMTQHAARMMIPRGRGTIVNIASIGAYAVSPTAAVYCATKYAVRAISEGLRQEVGGDIRVTLVSPGVTESELAESISDDTARSAMDDFRRIAIPADAIARAIAYAIDQPADVDVSELVVRPTASPY